MRSAALRPLLVVALTGVAALGTAAPAGAHGGTEIAEGGSKGVKILVNAAEATTPTGRPAIDLSTTLRGRGTGEDATVTYWIRPAGGKTFRVATTRDEAGIAHVDVPTAGRGDWRSWDVSAVVRLSTGERLRVSNAEANPPGPEPAAVSGGGATGADEDETSPDEAPATTEATPSSGGTAPDTADGGATTDDAPAAGSDATTTDAAPSSGDDGAIEDVTGEEDGAPLWAILSVPLILVLAIGAIVVGKRRAAAAERDDRD